MGNGLVKSIRAEFSWHRRLNTYNRVQKLYSKILRGRRFQLRKLAQFEAEYLNIGCGESRYDNFVNLDYQWRPNVDLCWDITEGIPLKSNSMRGIFVEHCLEHISLPQCQNVLLDLCRILKNGGILRLIVPDAELYFDLYQREKLGEDVAFPYVTQDDIGKGFTPIMAINRIFRNHGHQFAYDARTMEMLLKKAGFNNIRKLKFMEGSDKALLVDSEFRKAESLYMEASKK